MTFPCSGSAFRCRGPGPPRTRFAASPAAPRSSGTRRCGPSSACSTPSAPRSARRTSRCSTRSSRSRYVAGHTDRIRLGTATICAPFTAPALLAKTLTSLDVLSGGRLTVGLGMGWLPRGVRRRRRALRAARRADGRVPALPGGAVDAGPRRVRRRVLHRAALAHGPAARATAAPPGAAGRRRRAGAAPRRAARPGLDRQQPARPHRSRRVDRDGARRRARGRARPGGAADRGAPPSRRGSRCSTISRRCARRASRRSSWTSTSHPASTLEDAERVLEAFAPTRLRPSA